MSEPSRFDQLPDKHREVIGGLRDLALQMWPHPPEGWRTIAPADSIGVPAINIGYLNELTEIAQQRGLTIHPGATITADYEKRGNEWHPIPESVRVEQ